VAEDRIGEGERVDERKVANVVDAVCAGIELGQCRM
jgi:hypothetical protein